MFGLDRHVTINALSDIGGGPDSYVIQTLDQNTRLDHLDFTQDNVLTRLMGNTIDKNNELENDLDHDDLQYVTTEFSD
jgi:hypothetical protein